MNEKPYKTKNSANDLYNVYVNRELLHEYKNGSKITEGIYDLANKGSNQKWDKMVVLDCN
ncbi:hypothetical protein [Chryseobacterium oncorhynchi]|uniref:Uncharacterized protein n=1 Tax=Chryseobacterium oncorhynchi TaxID=741074 RepID=A0A316WF53_9FLAO|nr:hypothetical protein [Chryseobacterium oncorhynchi]PWN60054.1 hypothetical protein C1638_021030 [Chryseobacterium oncorhynchi]